MNLSLNETRIDEISMYNNGDDTFLVEINMSDKEGRNFKFKIPYAKIDLNLTSQIFGATTLKVDVEGELGTC